MPKKKTLPVTESGNKLPDPKNFIIIRGARQHNLKNVDLDIPKNKLVIVTGVSGSGKSSLVFDTIYAEGQRRYVESLSSYARQFLERMNKPLVDHISGLAPSMAIEQKTKTRNPCSTVGTSTEIYDYLRLLFARIGKTFSPVSNKIVTKDSPESIIEDIINIIDSQKTKIFIFYKFYFSDVNKLHLKFNELKTSGYYKILIKNVLYDLNDYSVDDLIKIINTTNDEYIGIITDRLNFEPNDRESISRFNDAIEFAYKESGGYAVIRVFKNNSDDFEDFSYNYYLERDGIKFEDPEPRLFSFNNPYGACESCQGFGKTMDIDMDLVIPDKKKSIFKGAILPFTTPKHTKHLTDLINEADNYNVDIHIPFSKLNKSQLDFVFNGGKKYSGIYKFFKQIEKEAAYKLHYRVFLNKYRAYTTCRSCGGARLRKEALYVKINGLNIFDIVRMKINEAYNFFNTLILPESEIKISGRIIEEITSRLKYLVEVGLTYLTLDRLSNSLSGGESQRINLSTSLGSSLVGSIYVLDEPSIGLHPRDNEKLINIMKSLRDIGNTVIVVEHDSDMMKTSDQIIDIGPLAGELGGEKIFQGTYKEILKDKNSFTGKYLSGKLSINVPKIRRKITENTKFINIKGARENNLKDIDVSIPLNMFVCITGVSGSGKSTLINNILFGGLKRKMDGLYSEKIGEFDSIEGINNIENVEIVDQSPIGKSPRSNPVTYIKAFDVIRELYSNLPASKKNGFTPGYFSFNVPGGRCETCEGTGIIKIEMQFMADIILECEVCKGKRYKTDILSVKYQGATGIQKNISEVLDMTVDEALEFFKNNQKIYNKIRVLSEVGLGYIRLGQSGATLSGGESQRVKLAYHLTFQEPGVNTLFIFDEPTTGLHFNDIAKLLKCFEKLIVNGNSLVVIEHNLDVIKCADYIFDLGPESGDDGGYIVAKGSPEEIAKYKMSHTGKFLNKILN